MKKHSFDMTSFLFGLVLGVAALGFLLAQQLSWDVDGRWVLPTALIVLGIAGIAGAIGGLRPENSSTAEASTSAPLADQDEDADSGEIERHDVTST